MFQGKSLYLSGTSGGLQREKLATKAKMFQQYRLFFSECNLRYMVFRRGSFCQSSKKAEDSQLKRGETRRKFLHKFLLFCVFLYHTCMSFTNICNWIVCFCIL